MHEILGTRDSRSRSRIHDALQLAIASQPPLLLLSRARAPSWPCYKSVPLLAISYTICDRSIDRAKGCCFSFELDLSSSEEAALSVMTVVAAAAAVEGGVGRRRRFALLLAARDSEYVRKVYGGYLEVFVRAFGDGDGGGEEWDMFRAVDGELPGADELDGYDGFVISGSPHDAYGDELWILRLCLLIRDLVALRKRLLGICFGHQVICRALGGRVGKARGGWDIGIREVAMAESLPPYRFLDDALQGLPAAAAPYAKITEVHQDEVWELPAGAEVLASSSKTGVEMFCAGDRVLGIQGHPEYTIDILLNLVDRLSSAGSITMAMAEAVRRQVEDTGPDREFWLKLCKSFLKTEEE